jgi:hypothetical protein
MSLYYYRPVNEPMCKEVSLNKGDMGYRPVGPYIRFGEAAAQNGE